MLGVFWWRCCWRCCWRWRCCWMCCCLITLSFNVPIVFTSNWFRCCNSRCTTHWNIAFRSCLIFCKLLRTNDRFVYNTLSNIMIRQPSSTILFVFCLFVCFFVCFYILFFFNNSNYVKTNMFCIMINIVYQYTLIYNICII